MNIHHLELFYYVARHGGISRAVRNMPYGIQQPAVSSQILLLEEDIGVKLFARSPFKLTPAGAELFDFIRPFFDNIAVMAARLRQKSTPQLRIAASDLVLRDYLPRVVERLRMQEPLLRLGLRSGYQAEMEKWLFDREVDLAVIPLRGRLPAQLRCVRLLRLPLVLLVSKKSKLKSAAELWAQHKPVEPLISLPPTESISQVFQNRLKKLGVVWPIAIEASSMELITKYVANGDGLGVNVFAPDVVNHPKVRVLPLEGFDHIELAAVWSGELTPLLRKVLEEMLRHVAEFWPQAKCDSKLPD